MKNFMIFVWIGYILAFTGLVIAIISKLSGNRILGASWYSYLFVSVICLLFVISIALVQIALVGSAPYFMTFVWIGYILALIGAVIAIITKLSGNRILGVSSDMLLIGCVTCLIFVISLSLVQIALSR
jgi:hypothetical protein